MPAEEAVRLRVHSGVPIVDVMGDWAPAVADSLAAMIGSLTEAGHFDIVVNVQRAAVSSVMALKALSRAAHAVRDHCGHIDVVGTAEQLDELLCQHMERFFRLAASEETAIGRIKRIPVLAPGQRWTARPAERAAG